MALVLILIITIEIFFLKDKMLGHIINQIDSENKIKINTINRVIDTTITEMSEKLNLISREYSTKEDGIKKTPINSINQTWNNIKSSNKKFKYKISYYDSEGKYHNISDKENPFDFSAKLNISNIKNFTNGKSFFRCDTYCQLFSIRPLSKYNLNSGSIQISINIDSIIDRISEGIYGIDLVIFKKANKNKRDLICLNHNKFIYEISIHSFSHKEFLTNHPEFSCEETQVQKESDKKIVANYLERDGILIVVSGSIEALSKKSNQAVTSIIINSLLIALVLMIVFYGMLSLAMKRVSILGEILGDIARKKFSPAKNNLEIFSRNKRYDEIDDIYRDVSNLTDDLEQAMLEIEYKNHQLTKKVDEVQLLADYDTLTDTFNRRKFSLILNSIFNRNEKFTLVSLDLNHFKLINDALGHATGDKVLVDFSKILASVFYKSGAVGRVGGDEFSVIIYSADIIIVSNLLQLVSNRTKDIFKGHSLGIHTSASIGAARFPYDSKNIDELSAFADAAMYENKRLKETPFHFYNGHETIIQEEREAQFWYELLDSSFSEERYVAYFQPIIAVKDHSLFSYEVLTRIKNKDVIHSPEKFIEHAEKNRKIIAIDKYILREAMLSGAKIGYPILNINLSYLTISSPHILNHIIKSSTENNYPLGNIIIEITETIEIKDVDMVRNFISAMKKYGVRFALDDFGTGFSSFSYMAKLGVDYIKLDKSLTQDLLDNKSNHHIVKSLISLCKSLGIKTIAEGVENPSILAEIDKYDFDYLQGYHFSKPKKVSDFSLHTTMEKSMLERP